MQFRGKFHPHLDSYPRHHINQNQRLAKKRHLLVAFMIQGAWELRLFCIGAFFKQASTAVTNSQPAPALSQSAATGSPIQKDGAMAGIARNVELYILAYKLDWKYISEDHKDEQPN